MRNVNTGLSYLPICMKANFFAAAFLIYYICRVCHTLGMLQEGCSLLRELSRNIEGDERTSIDDRAIIEELQFTEVNNDGTAII